MEDTAIIIRIFVDKLDSCKGLNTIKKRQTSLIRLDSKPTTAIEVATIRLFHQPTSRYEHILRISQNTKNIKPTLVIESIKIENVKAEIRP